MEPLRIYIALFFLFEFFKTLLLGKLKCSNGLCIEPQYVSILVLWSFIFAALMNFNNQYYCLPSLWHTVALIAMVINMLILVNSRKAYNAILPSLILGFTDVAMLYIIAFGDYYYLVFSLFLLPIAFVMIYYFARYSPKQTYKYLTNLVWTIPLFPLFMLDLSIGLFRKSNIKAKTAHLTGAAINGKHPAYQHELYP